MESLDQKETGDEKVTAPSRSLTPQKDNRAPTGSGGRVSGFARKGEFLSARAERNQRHA